MFFCGIYIFMSKYICNKINIICLPIQVGTISAPKFMWGDFFKAGYFRGIFFDQIFDTSYGKSAVLHGQKECIFMSGFRDYLFPEIEIILKL